MYQFQYHQNVCKIPVSDVASTQLDALTQSTRKTRSHDFNKLLHCYLLYVVSTSAPPSDSHSSSSRRHIFLSTSRTCIAANIGVLRGRASQKHIIDGKKVSVPAAAILLQLHLLSNYITATGEHTSD